MANQSMAEEFKSVGFWRAVIAEFVGMFLFILVGLLSTADWPDTQIPSMVQIGLAFGLALASAIHLTAHISGGHLNPAVSIAFWLLHKMTPLKCVLYIVAQCCGAIAAAGVVDAITPPGVNDGVGPTIPGIDVEDWQAFLAEFFLTGGLVLVIFSTVDSKRPSPGGSGPLAIGIWVAVAHLGAVSILT